MNEEAFKDWLSDNAATLEQEYLEMYYSEFLEYAKAEYLKESHEEAGNTAIKNKL